MFKWICTLNICAALGVCLCDGIGCSPNMILYNQHTCILFPWFASDFYHSIFFSVLLFVLNKNRWLLKLPVAYFFPLSKQLSHTKTTDIQFANHLIMQPHVDCQFYDSVRCLLMFRWSWRNGRNMYPHTKLIKRNDPLFISVWS